MAIGMIEVQGFSVALTVADAMCKTANIEIDAFDANNPKSGDVKIPVIVQVKIRGGVSDIYAALDTGRREAQNFLENKEIITACIPMENDNMRSLIRSGKLLPTEKREKVVEDEKKIGTIKTTQKESK